MTFMEATLYETYYSNTNALSYNLFETLLEDTIFEDYTSEDQLTFGRGPIGDNDVIDKYWFTLAGGLSKLPDTAKKVLDAWEGGQSKVQFNHLVESVAFVGDKVEVSC